MSKTPSVRAKIKIQDLLPSVRKGSKYHLLRLIDVWPNHPSDDLLDATDAVISFLVARKLPPQRLSIEDFEIAQSCFFGISRSLRATFPTPESDNKEIRDQIASLLLPILEREVTWMGMCIRHARVRAEEDHAFIQSACRLVARCAWTFAQQLSYHEGLKSAMQAMPIAARTLADIWGWTEPLNGLPLCIVGKALKDDFWKGCGIIDSMYGFTEGSDSATLLVLEEILGEGPRYSAAAEEFVRLSFDRVQMLDQACRAPKRDPPLILQSLCRMVRIMTRFVVCGDRHIRKALRKKPFLRQCITTLCTLSTQLWVDNFDNKDLASSDVLVPLQLVHDIFPLWANAFPPATYVMRELLDATLNLPTLLLSTLAFFQTQDIMSLPGEYPKTAMTLYSKVLDWVVSFTIFPSITHKVYHSFRDVNKDVLASFCSNYDHWTVRLWHSFTRILKTRSDLLSSPSQNSRTDLCDNIYHAPTAHGMRTRSKQRSCSGCHSAMYCSERCQREDWKARHREDCEHLGVIYAERKRTDRWISGSMRLFLLKIVEHAYLSGLPIGTNASLPVNDSVTSFDFTRGSRKLFSVGSSKQTFSDYVNTLDKNDDPRGIGIGRMDALLSESANDPRVRIVCATFDYRGLIVQVVIRTQSALTKSKDKKPHMIGGFHFIEST